MDRCVYVDVQNNRPRLAMCPLLPGPYTCHPSRTRQPGRDVPLQSWSSAPSSQKVHREPGSKPRRSDHAGVGPLSMSQLPPGQGRTGAPGQRAPASPRPRG